MEHELVLLSKESVIEREKILNGNIGEYYSRLLSLYIIHKDDGGNGKQTDIRS